MKFCEFIKGVSIADNMGRKGGTISTILLWISQRPYKIPDFEAVWYN